VARGVHWSLIVAIHSSSACLELFRKEMQPWPLALRLGGTLAVLLCHAYVDAVSVTPVQKVTELLQDMRAKGEQEKHEEQVAFAAFNKFCNMVQKEKQRLIREAADRLRDLEAKIAKGEALAASLGEDIDELDQKLAAWSTEQAEADAQRKQERADYDATHTDYTASISALEQAIELLKAQEKHTRQNDTAVLLELKHRLADSPRGSVLAQADGELEAYMKQRFGEATETAEPANAYELQSGSVVDMLEKLRIRFQDERTDLEKREMNMRHAYEGMKQVISDNVQYAEKTRTEKVSAKAKLLQDVAAAKGDVEETQAGKTADEKYLQDLTGTCRVKSGEFEKRQALRTQELAAIDKAIEIVSTSMAGAAEKHLPAAAWLQRPSPRNKALAQLRSSTPDASNVQASVSAFLAKQAKKIDSSLLATLAGHAKSDPFEKVKQMIKDLLVRLQEEAEDEADHKGWCDKQLATNKQSRDTLSAEVESLSAQVDELSSLEVTLAAEVKELAEVIAAIDDAVAKASAERAEEKATNNATIFEASQGQKATTEAIRILREFYAQTGEATVLLQDGRSQATMMQTPAEDLPATWDTAYQGMQGEHKGVIGMLEVIQADFARLQAETTTAEDAAKMRHDKFLEDSEVDKAVKDRTMRHKGYKRDSTLRKLHDAKKELDTTQEMLTDALAYYEKLKPSCVDLGLSSKERVQQREDEIQSLKEALHILGGQDFA